jgi:hypothetical protein
MIMSVALFALKVKDKGWRIAVESASADRGRKSTKGIRSKG